MLDDLEEEQISELEEEIPSRWLLSAELVIFFSPLALVGTRWLISIASTPYAMGWVDGLWVWILPLMFALLFGPVSGIDRVFSRVSRKFNLRYLSTTNRAVLLLIRMMLIVGTVLVPFTFGASGFWTFDLAPPMLYWIILGCCLGAIPLLLVYTVVRDLIFAHRVPKIIVHSKMQILGDELGYSNDKNPKTPKPKKSYKDYLNSDRLVSVWILVRWIGILGVGVGVGWSNPWIGIAVIFLFFSLPRLFFILRKGGMPAPTDKLAKSVWEYHCGWTTQAQDICTAWMSKGDYGKQGYQGWEVDRIIPKSRGGTDDLSNLRPLHWKNSNAKGDKLDGQWQCAKRSGD